MKKESILIMDSLTIKIDKLEDFIKKNFLPLTLLIIFPIFSIWSAILIAQNGYKEYMAILFLPLEIVAISIFISFINNKDLKKYIKILLILLIISTFIGYLALETNLKILSEIKTTIFNREYLWIHSIISFIGVILLVKYLLTLYSKHILDIFFKLIFKFEKIGISNQNLFTTNKDILTAINKYTKDTENTNKIKNKILFTIISLKNDKDNKKYKELKEKYIQLSMVCNKNTKNKIYYLSSNIIIFSKYLFLCFSNFNFISTFFI